MAKVKVNRKLIVTKRTREGNTLPYEAYETIPLDMLVHGETDKGTRLALAKYKNSQKFYLRDVYEAGEPSWPYGGVTVWSEADQYLISCYLDSVSIHPTNFIKRRTKKNIKRVDLPEERNTLLTTKSKPKKSKKVKKVSESGDFF